MRAVLLICAVFASGGAWACDGVTTSNGWVREAPPDAEMLAGYVTLKNSAKKSRTLRGVKSPGFGMVEVHETRMVDGQMQMRALEALRLPAGGQVELAPGGRHLMLMQPVKPLKSGDTVILNFDCGRHKPLQVTLPVKSAVEP